MKLSCGCLFQFPNLTRVCNAHLKAREARVKRNAAHVMPNPWAERQAAETTLQRVTKRLQTIEREGLPGYVTVGYVIDPEDGDHPAVLFSRPAKGYKPPKGKKPWQYQFDPKSRKFQMVEI